MYANKSISEDLYYAIDWVFTSVFLTELSLKLLGYYEYFFLDAWNVYDFIIITIALLESVIVSLELNADVARTLRLLRAFRLFRVVGVFQALNKLVVALVDAIVSVLWVFLLAFMIIYMMGVICTTAMGPGTSIAADFPKETGLYFRNVQGSMLTLLQIMTLDSWAQIPRKYGEMWPITSCCLIIYMLGSALILMNLLTAIFVDRLVHLTDEVP